MSRIVSPIDTRVVSADPGRTLPATSQGPETEPAFAIRKVLVVCLGNVCRSPIAEFVLRRRLAGRDVIVESAGIAATDGARIDPRALSVLDRHGIDADAHVARRLDQRMLDAADLVLVMERSQLELIRSQIPSAAGKTFLLGKWQGGFEIPDPLGKPHETFEHVFRTVEQATRRWCELI
jgi:protein-tyrosine phosphatase